MKILLFISLLFLPPLLAEAQTQGDIRLPIGSEYAISIEAIGVNIGAEYFLSDNVSFVSNYTHFFPDQGKAGSFNLDARYYLSQEILQWYGLLGFTNNWATDELI